MRKKWLVLASAVCALPLLVALLLDRPWEREPRYHGRPLSYWLASTQDDTDNDLEIEVALDHMGTNALPFLLKWIRYERPHWRDTLFEKAPASLENFTIASAELRADASVEALAYLGTNAAAGFKELTTLAQDTKAPRSAGRAMRVLSGIGPDGIQFLLAMGRNTNNANGGQALSWLGVNSGDKALQPLRVAALTQLIGETNSPGIRDAAVILMAHQITVPTLAIPPLLHCITNDNSDSQIRARAINVLRRFGPLATNTLPALTNALTDRSQPVRTAATNAIHDILNNSTPVYIDF